MMQTIRIARPTDQLEAVVAMYRDGLELVECGAFEDHDGFDGVILGRRDWPCHLEFTHHRGHAVGKAPSQDHLLVFYLPDSTEWQARCTKLREAGFAEVASYNPYWDRKGATFEDVDGYRVVLQNEAWRPVV